MENCSNHSQRQAAWKCTRCGKALCEQCAQGEDKPGLPTVVCAHCGGLAKILRKPKDVRKYWQMFPDFIGVLFGYKGLLQLFAVALVVQIVSYFTCVGALIGLGLYAAYYFLVLRSASNGEIELPGVSDFSNPVDDILLPLVRMVLAMSLPVIPPVAYLVWRYQSGLPEDPLTLLSDPFLVAISLVCVAWVPGALIVAAVNESAGAQLNPLNVISIVLRIPGEYLVTVLVWVALQGANGALMYGANLMAQMAPIPIVMPILVRFVGLFVPMLTAMVLGRLIYQNAERFGLSLSSDDHEPVMPLAVPRGRLSRDARESSFVPGGVTPVVERSVAPWESPRRAATRMPAASEASVAPWEKPRGATMPAVAEDSIPLDGSDGPRGTPPGGSSAGSYDSPPPGFGSQGFAAAEESIPLDGDEGPRGVRPGMGPASPDLDTQDPFAPFTARRSLDGEPGPSTGRRSLDGEPVRVVRHAGFDDRAAGRFDDTPEPIPILDMPQPSDEEIAGALHVGPGGTFAHQPPQDGAPPSRDPDGTPVDHQPPAEDFAPQTLGGDLPPAAETSFGDAAAISVSLDAGALDNPLRMALESGDSHSALMNFREQMGLGVAPDLSPELELRLASMLEQAGQFGDAVMACKRASEREPDGPLAARATFEGARLLVERLGNRGQGAALLQYLLRHYGQDPVAAQAQQLLDQVQEPPG